MIKQITLYNIILQILDGLLTFWGVNFLGYGTAIEGNPFVSYLMNTFGVFNGLLIAKLFGIIMIISLHFLFQINDKVKRLFWAYIFVTLIYTYVVGDWIYTFINFILTYK